jgi:hypothetical protein
MIKTNNIFLNVILPIAIGGFIYILFREKSLLMFSWFTKIGLDNLIHNIRTIAIWNYQLPDWVIYSLPDGIWVYSLTSLMLIIWYGDVSILKYFWLSIGLIIGLSIELCQLMGFYPGTFDKMDILFYIIGSITPIILFYQTGPSIKKWTLS